MCNRLTPWKIAAAFALSVGLAASAAAQEADGIKWRNDYSTAKRESEAKSAPMLIYFTRPACVYCDKMEATTYRDSRIVSMLNDKLVVLKINGQEQPQWATRLNVTAYPTLIL